MTWNGDGTFTYTPDTDFTGTDTFTYTVCLPAPDQAVCDTATETIKVGLGAVDDAYTTPFETPMTTGDVKTGDAYPVGSTFTKTTDPSHGTVTWNGDGTFTYTPDTGFTGTDSFTYTVCKPVPNETECDTATETIVVGPDAVNDAYTTPFDTPMTTGDVRTDDTYPVDSTFTKTTDPSHGSVTWNGDGTFTYTPTTGFTGTDTFTYTVCMPAPNASMCDTATETIVVGPNAVDDSYGTAMNTPMTTGDVKTGDTYPTGSTFAKTTDPTNGSVTWNADGTFTYTPNTGFTMDDPFTRRPRPSSAVMATLVMLGVGGQPGM